MREGKRKLGFAPLAGAMCVLGVTGAASAAISIDGSLDAAYGGPLATQTVNTGFGDSTVGDGTSTGGSELDAAYGVVSGGNLNLFLAGNFENNGNHVNIFIADGRAGQSTLNASGGPLNGANGMTFPAGFSATYAIDANDFSNTVYFDTFDLIGNTSGYAGGISLTGGIGNGSLAGGVFAGINNTNAAGVNGNAGTAADPFAADAVATGLEISIPLSTLGNPTGPIQVIADINGGGDNYLSNQFLGGLPVGTGNLASPGSVNLNGLVTPFVVGVPEPTGAVFVGLAGGTFLLLSGRSRRLTVVSR